MRNSGSSAKILRCFGYQAASQTAIAAAAEVDMKGFEACTFILTLGTMVNLSSVTATVHQGNTSGALAASKAASGAVISDGTDGTQIVIEVVKPLYRYLRLGVVIATQNAVVENIIAIATGPRDEPVTQNAAVISGNIFVSPANA